MKLTRRDFIKTAGAATGTMAISSVIPRRPGPKAKMAERF